MRYSFISSENYFSAVNKNGIKCLIENLRETKAPRENEDADQCAPNATQRHN